MSGKVAVYATVADCSRVGIGYTSALRRQFTAAVADCSRVGIGYTWLSQYQHSAKLRIARGSGLVTLPRPQAFRGLRVAAI